MNKYDTIGMIKQRLEILWELVEQLEIGGGGSGDSYTKAESDARYVRKEAGKGLSTNDFTDAYKDQIDDNADDIADMFTPDNVVVSEGGNVDAATIALAALHQPIKLNGKQFYYLGGDQSVVDYFAIDNNGNLVVYFARIQLSNGQVIVLTSIVGSASPEENGDDLFTTGGAYDLQVALESLIADKTDVGDVFGTGDMILNVDLDDYKSNHLGQYYTQNAAGSGSLNNCPYVEAAGHLTVQEMSISGGETYILQTWQANSASGQYQTYQRKWRGSSNGWTPWFRVAMAYDDLRQPINSFSGSIDLNNLQGEIYIGTYRATTSASNNITNQPSSGSFILFIRALFNTSSFQQEIRYTNEPNAIYIRNYTGGAWSSWYKFEGTAVV